MGFVLRILAVDTNNHKIKQQIYTSKGFLKAHNMSTSQNDVQVCEEVNSKKRTRSDMEGTSDFEDLIGERSFTPNAISQSASKITT